MITALVLSVFAAISGLLGPLITQYALDNTIPQKIWDSSSCSPSHLSAL